VVHPTGHGLDQVGGNDPVRLDPEVGVAITVRHRLAGDLQDELEALGGNKAEPADLAFKQLVGRDRRAVAHRHDGGRVRASQPEYLGQPGDEALRRVGWRRRRLSYGQLAGALVVGHHIGECPAGVDAYPDMALSCRHLDGQCVEQGQLLWGRLTFD
jgi:hypothetical protein